VSEVGLEITGTCLLLSHIMVKEMEKSLQQMMERLLARQSEEMKDPQDKAHAEAKTRQEQLRDDINGHMEALLKRLRSCSKRVTACQVSSMAVQKIQGRPRRNGDRCEYLRIASEKMESTGLVANTEATKAVV
jgi:hypothetical protein